MVSFGTVFGMGIIVIGGIIEIQDGKFGIGLTVRAIRDLTGGINCLNRSKLCMPVFGNSVEL